MPKIVSTADLKNKFSEIADYLNNHGQPVFITRNGQGAYAIMSMEAYDTLAGQSVTLSIPDLKEIFEKLDEAEAEFKNGEGLSLDELGTVIKNRHEKI